MLEHVLDIYLGNVTRRFIISEKEFKLLLKHRKGNDSAHPDHPLEMIWDFEDTQGKLLSFNLADANGIGLFKREVKNPMELDEHYENPLS